ncbi:MAG: patatin-like phospholipase family protein [Gammaproteobacteria bacterium]
MRCSNVLLALLLGLPGVLPATAGTPGSPAAAAPDSPHRPRIGLALSGGGARGTAHIGVLEALEEMHIPVDYIAGTSMGAVVGGFYASGMSTRDIRALLNDIDWVAIFNDRSPRIDKSFRRKQDEQLDLVNARIGFNDGAIQFPGGVIQGQKLDLLFAKYTRPVAGVQDFDDLMIPYRAVAADLVTGEAVALKSGSLGEAMRASMSIPGVITPAVIDDRVLVDGGIAMNLPVDVLRQMGADIVIAVDISTPLRTRQEVGSILAVTDQLTNFLTRRGTEAQLAKLGKQDVLILPDLGNIATADFERVDEAIPTGDAAVRAKAAELARLSLPPQEYAAWRAGRLAKDNRIVDTPIISFVRLNNNSRVGDEVIEARLGGIKLGEPLDTETLEKAISKVYGLELFERVSYSLVTKDMQTGIEIDVSERRWGPNYLQFGLSYSASNDDEVRAALSVSYLRTAMNRRGGELRTTLTAGDEPALMLDFYQPLARDAAFFFAPKLSLVSLQSGVFEQDERVAEARIRGGLFDLGFGREIGAWGEIRAGYQRGVGDLKLVSGAAPFIHEGRFNLGNVFLRFSVDNQDDAGFPNHGTRGRLEWLLSRESVGADDNFDQVLLDIGHARTRGRYSLLGGVQYLRTVHGVAPLVSQFRLGGFTSLSGYVENELTGQDAGRLFLAGYRRIGDLALLPLYGGVTAEYGNVWQSNEDVSFADGISAGSLWVGADTPLGPIYLAYGLAEGGRSVFYLLVGRVF